MRVGHLFRTFLSVLFALSLPVFCLLVVQSLSSEYAPTVDTYAGRFIHARFCHSLLASLQNVCKIAYCYQTLTLNSFLSLRKQQQQTEYADQPVKLSKHFQGLVAKCLQKDPTKRPNGG
jgi:hypothetical protein